MLQAQAVKICPFPVGVGGICLVNPPMAAKADSQATERALVRLVVQITQEIPHDRVADALLMLSILHPAEKKNRAIMLYSVLLVGALLALGAGRVLVGIAPTPYALAPLVCGGVLVGSVFAAAIGRPPSVADMGQLTRTLGAALDAAKFSDNGSGIERQKQEAET